MSAEPCPDVWFCSSLWALSSYSGICSLCTVCSHLLRWHHVSQCEHSIALDVGVFVFAECKARVTWPNNMFWLSRAGVSSGRCLYVAKIGLLLSCGPEGCWDGEPKPCGEISLWRRTMFKTEPLWAVYAVLNQHYTHLAGGKTNTTYKLKLKNTLLWLPSCIITSCRQLHHILHKSPHFVFSVFAM